MKKLLTSVLCTAMLLMGGMTTSFAADGLNTDEQRLLSYFEKGITAYGENTSWQKGSEEYESMKMILESEGVDLTATEVDTIKNSAKDIEAYINTFDEDAEMTSDILVTLLAKGNPALEVLGLKASYDSVKDVLTIKTQDGEVIQELKGIIGTQGSDIIKNPETNGTKLEKTGEDYGSTYAIIGGLAMLLIAAGSISLKKKETV